MPYSNTPTDLPEQLQGINSHYRSGQDDIGKAFFFPCLEASARYDRAAAYFSSAALVRWTGILPRIVRADDCSIRLVIAPELSRQDKEVLTKATNEEERDALRRIAADRIIQGAYRLQETPTDEQLRLELFAWLVANDKVNIQFAFAEHVEDPGMYHEKFGIFHLLSGHKIAFAGSANETEGGHRRNYESVDVFRSWIPSEMERVEQKNSQFDETWRNKAGGLIIRTLSEESLELIRERAASYSGAVSTGSTPPKDDAVPDAKWRHQEDALSAFLHAKCGVLEMATGTGKTRTAMMILTRLVDIGEISGAIVCTDGNPLLDQWSNEILAWTLARDEPWRVYRHYGRQHHEAERFALNPDGAVLLISRSELNHLFTWLPEANRSSVLIVHDEVHGFGSSGNIKHLAGTHKGFKYRLGLSATPEREHDAVGTDFILQEVGPVLFQFHLEDAIKRGILCEFDYDPLPYELTEGDKRRLQKVYMKAAVRKREGNPMPQEEIWRDLSLVYKTAENKPHIFREYLETHPEVLQGAIVFVATQEFGESFYEAIHGVTHRFRKFFSGEARVHLLDFAAGEIDCLITCHRLSQGIDIPALRHIILVSSDRTRLETIQRIGRCLRTSPAEPEKRSRIVDFVRASTAEEQANHISADAERCAWLTELSLVCRERTPTGEKHEP